MTTSIRVNVASGPCIVNPKSTCCPTCTDAACSAVALNPMVIAGQSSAGTVVRAHCDLEGARTEGAATIGPYARLRPGTVLADGVHVGNFVEAKNTVMGIGSKANHLTYLGDAAIGNKVNIGAGTITCNYDGVNKSKTTIGDGAFIGSNASLVAPVEIGEDATIGAGSVITHDAPAGKLTVARCKQATIEGWKRPKKNS